jgi:hypothetical protein
MLMADVTEIVFDACDKAGEVVQLSLIVRGHHEGSNAVEQCRQVVNSTDALDEFLVIIRVTHIQVPFSLLTSLPLLDLRESDIEPTYS